MSRTLRPILLLAALSLFGQARAQVAWVNEFHYDNDGTDADEFVEIVVLNPEELDLGRLQVTLYNGSNGAVYASAGGEELTRASVHGYYALYLWAPSDMQNGPDGIAVSYDERTLDFVSYEGSFLALDGPAAGLESTDAGPEEATDTPAGRAIFRTGSGGSGDEFTWSGPETATPGGPNVGQTLAAIPLTAEPTLEPLLPGDTAAVPVRVGSPSDPVEDLVGAGFQLRYDPRRLRYLDHEIGEFLAPQILEFLHADSTEGTVAFGVSRQAPESGSTGAGTLATFRFRVRTSLEADTVLTVALEDVLATDVSGSRVPLVPLGGSLALSTGPTLAVSVDSLDAGVFDWAVGRDTIVHLANAGGTTLSVTGISTSHPGVTVAPSAFEVVPGDSQAVTVTLRPAEPDTVEAVLSVISTDTEQPIRTVAVRGVAVPFVWPGDTDNDGSVDIADVLPLGRHFGRRGPERGYGLAWFGREAPAWTPIEATYADATGDGRISQNDLQPIGFHYGSSRAAGKETNPTVLRLLALRSLAVGVDVPVHLRIPGDARLRGALGIAVELAYPPEVLELTDVRPASWIDDGDLLVLERVDPVAGRAALAYTRKRGGEPLDGHGAAITLEFRIRETRTVLPEIRLLRSLSSTGDRPSRYQELLLESPLALPTGADVRLPDRFALRGSYPNPFNGRARVVVDLPRPSEVTVTLYDLLGRRRSVQGPFERTEGRGRSVPVDAARLPSGTYLYRVRARSAETTYRAIGRMTLLK